jgi:Ca-activated chloride channel homolog
MKVRTVGALAALGMSLTSYSVWSLTGDAGTVEAPRTRHEWREAPPRDVPPAASRASFTTEGTLHLDARLGNARLPSGSASETFVLVRVRAEQTQAGESARRHLSIAIDRSGSMSGRRLANAVAAAQGAVQRLADGDSVSVVDYANTAHVLVAPTELGPGTRERVSAKLGALSAGGQTCISCALETTRGLLRAGDDAVERVLLLSDGEATAGVRDVPGMRRIADGLRGTGVTVTTIGVDVDYNERMMTAIAQATNGRHYFVASPEGLPAIFDRELSGLERSVARAAKVELDLAPGVELVELADRDFSRDGSHLSVALGSFSAGEERSVLARVRVRADAATEQPILSARLSYDDLALGRPAQSSGELVLKLTDDGSRSPLDPEVLEHVQRSDTASALTDANGLFEAGDAPAARERVAKKLDEVRRGRETALAAVPAPQKARLAEAFDKEEAALGAASSAFAEPPPSSASSSEDVRKNKTALKQNAERAADLTF